ncbi:ArsR/SmtB family transcription factor [Acidicapsa ligni]|uniref:ArsR/SmtB family transcription factor n=1 Tax=Acidicapsa ligni TaxID=542300 RepID=UPI0021E0D474|nr:metalloregulator ArsR/SmtB family transcription factor [Acidicapsa ligni]
MGKITENEAAQIGKALGDPNRLAIYSQIAHHDELFCGEMHAKQRITLPTLSHHLKVLTDLGLITHRKEGLNVYYRVVPERFNEYVKFLTRIGTRSS